MNTTKRGWAIPAYLLSFLFAACGQKDTSILKVNLGIPVQKPTIMSSLIKQANFIPGPSCRQDQVYILMAKPQGGVFYKKKILLQSSLNSSGNSCMGITYGNTSNDIQSAINRLKNCSWLLEEPTVAVPSELKLELGIAGTFYEPKDVNKDGICDQENLNHLPGGNQAYPENNFWGYFPNLNTARSNHSMTELSDGKILVFGGKNANNATTQSYEIYRPSNQNWQTFPGTSLTARSHHTATKLSDGRVVIIGGKDTGGFPVSTIHILKNDENWLTPNTPAGFNSAIFGHTANLINQNKILIIGGSIYNNSSSSFSSTKQVGILTISSENELSWDALAELPIGRQNHTATIVDQDVYIIGGFKIQGNSSYTLGTILKLNLTNNTWTSINNINFFRVNHTSTLLPNKKIAIIGGTTDVNIGTAYSIPLKSFHIYNPYYDPNEDAGPLNVMAENLTGHSGHETHLLPNGSLLVIGGDNTNSSSPVTVELYDQNITSWRQLSDKQFDTVGFKSILYQGRKIISTGGTGTNINDNDENDDNDTSPIASNQAETFYPGNRLSANQTSLLGHQEITDENIKNGNLELAVQMIHGNPTQNYDFTAIIPQNKKDWTQIPTSFNSTNNGISFTARPISVELMHGLNEGGILFSIFRNSGNWNAFHQIPHIYPLKIRFTVESGICTNNSGHNTCGIYETVVQDGFNHNSTPLTLNLVEKYVIQTVPNNLSVINGIQNH